MVRATTAKFRIGSVAALAGVALVVAGCGSSSNSSSSASAPATPAPASAPQSSGGLAISTTSGPDGTYLSGASGRAIYLWVADSGSKSNCSAECAKVWPPVLTNGKPTAASGVSASDLATTTRSDGAKQVTYMGHPLYYFIADSSSDPTKGQGSDSFGAKWWLVAPAGSDVTASVSSFTAAGAAPAAPAAPASSPASSSAGGSWS
jgi:predicted lipoprotein with Yx(FWY)xxD motif